MITGSLQIKKNIYYAVLNLTDENGKRKQKWVSTGLSSTGHNKRAAAKELASLIDRYNSIPAIMRVPNGIVFTDYARMWVKSAEYTYDPVTYQGYKQAAEKHIIPYFERLGIKLQDVTPEVVQEFISYLSQHGNLRTGGSLANKSVRNFITVLSQILEDAVEKKKISENPVNAVKRPKKQKYRPAFYSTDKMRELFSVIQDEPLAPAIIITGIYGLRREELLGLKWDSVDFDRKCVTIQHVVTKFSTVIEKDDTKTEESHRQYPMPPIVEKIFLDAKEKENNNRILFGPSYQENSYVFKWDDGRPYSPDYLTRKFKKILKKYGMPIIRLHDLRHSCASILLESGHNLKDVKNWLGHSDIQTTGNIYGHLTNEHIKTVGDDMCARLF